MTTRKLFSNFFSKQGEKKHNENQQSRDDDEHTEQNRTLQRSRSGRLKEISKKRPSVAQDTFLPPKNASETGQTEFSLPKKEITGQESARLSLSIRELMRSGENELHGNEDNTENNPPLQDEIF